MRQVTLSQPVLFILTVLAGTQNSTEQSPQLCPTAPQQLKQGTQDFLFLSVDST